jgi:hypothetical protein
MGEGIDTSTHSRQQDVHEGNGWGWPRLAAALPFGVQPILCIQERDRRTAALLQYPTAHHSHIQLYRRALRNN